MVSKIITESVHSPAESDKSVEAQLQADHHSDLYLSLEEALKNPSCVSDTWIENITDLKNNPRTLPYTPVKEMYGRSLGCTEDGRDGWIGATRYAGGNGTRKEAEKRNV